MSEELKSSTESTFSNQNDNKVNWKKILSTNLTHSNEIIQSQRKWSMFCINLRDLCPETQWISIAKIETPIDTTLLRECESLINSLVISSKWPFPEKVVLVLDNTAHFKLKISLVTDHRPVFDFISKSLRLTHDPSSYASCWIIEKKSTTTKLLQGEV